MIRMFSLVACALCLALTGCPNSAEAPKPGGAAPQPVAQPAADSAPAPAAEKEDGAKDGDFTHDIDFAINYDDNFHSHSKGRFGGLLAVLGSHQFHVEIIPLQETGDILAILYDDHFKPFKSDVKELTLSLMVGGEPKQFNLLVNFEGSKEKPALYKISDAALAKLLHDGWSGNAFVSLTVDGNPVKGKLAPLK